MRRIIFVVVYIVIIFFLYVQLPEVISYEDDVGFTEAFFCQEINCSKLLIDLLDVSNNSFCAFYDLDESSVIIALTKNDVDTLLFKDNYEEHFSENIQPVSSAGLMHNKFCVFDKQYVLTGSWNPTYQGTEKNDNYVVFISSKSLAKSFLEEYNYLQTRKNEPTKLFVNLSGIPINLYYCPLHDCEENVLNELSQAKNSIKILAFSFTSKPIAELLVNKSSQGVNVTVVFEKTRIASYSQYNYLNKSGISVFKDANKYTMHEKLFIIDDETVVVGSYNPTKAATEKNDENMLIIENDVLAKTFQSEFQKVLNLSKQQN